MHLIEAFLAEHIDRGNVCADPRRRPGMRNSVGKLTDAAAFMLAPSRNAAIAAWFCRPLRPFDRIREAHSR